MVKSPVWFITGCSSGIGRALAQAVLSAGHRVVLTARTIDTLQPLATRYPGNSLVLPLDVTKAEQIHEAVTIAESHFGSIDVLVNNAGVGYIAAVEEGQEEEIRWQFEANFFGPAALTRAVLPGMRERGQGTIVNVSSVAGFIGMMGMGYYSASKFALEGLTEALWQEIEPLGLKAMLVELGGFRTGMAQRGKTSDPISAYLQTAGAVRQYVQGMPEESIAGDPDRAAIAILHAVDEKTLTRRLVLGTDAYAGIMGKLATLQQEYAASEAVARSTDFVSVDPGITPFSLQ
ncbi:oxidoreductase [Granulicella arctica]|uniref:oxidoreductase n=1 Tax=Granulicella arctica TaxID=940613 RepID=UPI0021DF74B8|nr:oxidoreductase [Granulicella arctica]